MHITSIFESIQLINSQTSTQTLIFFFRVYDSNHLPAFFQWALRPCGVVPISSSRLSHAHKASVEGRIKKFLGAEQLIFYPPKKKKNVGKHLEKFTFA